MKAIGGYFELEKEGEGVFPHKNGILLNTGRNALEYILRSLNNINLLYIPFYTCEVVLEPIKRLNIPYKYYHINHNLEIEKKIDLKSGEYLIVNNYYGIKDLYLHNIIPVYGKQLIIDCAQAFFTLPIIGTKMFYSPRKFLGVPDGGIAYGVNKDNIIRYPKDDSTDRLSHLYIRRDYGAEKGFKTFQDNEEKLNCQEIHQMSSFTLEILNKIDYQSIIKKRKENFKYLHQNLKEYNMFSLPSIDNFTSPMAYPFISENTNLRKILIDNKIFVARYWPNVNSTDDFKTEAFLAESIIPLPIDQRYGYKEMNKIINIIKNEI